MALSQREKALVAVPVLLGGLLGFYRWAHEPLLARRAAAQEASDQAKTDLRAQRAKLDKEGDLPSRLSAVTARENTLDAWVPGKNSATLFIWHLSQAEARSGVKIRGLKVGEREEVKRTTAEGTTEGDGASVPTLTMVQLDLKLDGRFAEQLLFNQELESTPLFLSTNSLEIKNDGKSPVDRVGNLLAEGNRWMASKVLGTSPTLGGAYQIRLYFKSAKAGPSTDAMQFGQPTGRPDPFVMDGVDQFLQTLIDFYTNGPGGTHPGADDHPGIDPGTVHSQMG